MKLRSMDPYDEPAWWRWPAVVELRLIAGDFVRAWYWMRRVPYRIASVFYRRFPSRWPPCPNCGNPRDRLPVLPVGWQLSRRWQIAVLAYPVITWCGDCQRTERRRQAEEFNAALDQELRRLELMKKWQSLPPAASLHQEKRRDQQFRDLLDP